MILGVDVSKWQISMNWIKAYNAGVRFAFLKASEGKNYIDPMFRAYANGCAETGIPFAAYHFWRDNVPALAQAELVLSVVRRDWPDAPIAIDVEDFSSGLGAKANARNLRDMVNALKAAGAIPTIYTSKSKWDTNIADINLPWGALPLWVAHYTTGAPLIPRGWNDWMVHQYSSSGEGSTYGAGSKFIDLNHVKEKYIEFYGGVTSPPEPEPPAVKIVVPETLTATVDGVTYTWRLS